MSTHTHHDPAPFRIAGTNSSIYSVPASGNIALIASLHMTGGYACQRANACLFVAAPDLLAVAEQALQWWESRSRKEKLCGEPAWLIEARAAVDLAHDHQPEPAPRHMPEPYREFEDDADDNGERDIIDPNERTPRHFVGLDGAT